MISFRDLKTPQDVDQWIARLRRDRPERQAVMHHISRQIAALPFSAPHVVELGLGPGLLAELLLTELPQITYTGLDFSALLLATARERLAPFGDRVRLIHADLNADAWPDHLSGKIQAIVSMQALHDLGGESQVNRIYRMAKALLVPDGLFLNADLVVPPGQDRPDNPGRRSIPRHLELLRSHGYERISCTLELSDFGCVVGFAPE